MVWKVFFPVFNKLFWNRLSTNVHKTPLIKMEIFFFKVSTVKTVQNILSPRYQQPDDCTKLIRNGFKYSFRLCSTQQYSLASRNKGTEPVHFCSSMIKRRNTKENIIFFLAVMLLFYSSRMHKGTMLVQNSLRETCCSRTKINCSFIIICNFNIWIFR